MRTRTVLNMCLPAIVLVLLASTFGMAQFNSGDSGQYQILQARYGTERRNVDVTSRLKELARQDRTFRMGNSTFGVDPDPGVIKVLRIYARDQRGRDRMFEFTEGSTVDGSMFTGWSSGNWGQGRWDGGWGGRNSNGGGDEGQYEILQARYGTERRNVDVTSRLRELALRDTTFRMGNSTFGIDPDPGVVKTLRIFTRDRRGRDRMFEFTEGSTVDGSMFVGWSSGNWGRGGWNGGWGDRNDRGDRDDRRDRDGGFFNAGGGSGALNIISASYGAGRQRRDVTAQVRSLVRDGRLAFTVTNEVLGGDPVPNVAKDLRITFTSRGREQEMRVSEGQRVNVP